MVELEQTKKVDPGEMESTCQVSVRTRTWILITHKNAGCMWQPSCNSSTQKKEITHARARWLASLACISKLWAN